jgi:hypothetical protein
LLGRLCQQQQQQTLQAQHVQQLARHQETNSSDMYVKG